MGQSQEQNMEIGRGRKGETPPQTQRGRRMKLATDTQIPTEHPIWTAKAWGRPEDMLYGLPITLQRWFAVDVLEACWTRHRLTGPVDQSDPQTTVMMQASIEKGREFVFLMLEEDGASMRRLKMEMEAHNNTMWRYSISRSPTVRDVWGVMLAALHVTSFCAAVGAVEVSDRGRLMERFWFLSRLRYLCEVWRTCGGRSARLLHEGKCPIPWEPLQ